MQFKVGCSVLKVAGGAIVCLGSLQTKGHVRRPGGGHVNHNGVFAGFAIGVAKQNIYNKIFNFQKYQVFMKILFFH